MNRGILMNRPASQNWVPDDPCQVTICRLIALSIVVHQRPDCCPQDDQARYQWLPQPLIVSSGMITPDKIQPQLTKKHKQSNGLWHNVASINSYMGLEDEAFSALLLIQDQIHFWNPFVRISIGLLIYNDLRYCFIAFS